MTLSQRREHVESYPSSVLLEPAPGIQVSMMACGALGACGLTTCLVSIAPGKQLPYHTHPTGEAIVVLEGQALADVDCRRYVLEPYDALYVPQGVVHGLASARNDQPVWLGTAFPTAEVTRQFVNPPKTLTWQAMPRPSDPESLRLWRLAEPYSISDRIETWDLFAGRWKSEGVCGGIATFAPGAGLACHVHPFDESITILQGVATCWVAGRQYSLSERSTILVPSHLPHRFINTGQQPMVMLWVYAASEPARTFVDPSLCEPTILER